MTRVEAPSRLHFGLLQVRGTRTASPIEGLPERNFGGIGLMIDSPGVVVSVQPAVHWESTGPLADRALHFGRMFQRSLGSEERAFQIRVERCPPQHIGLGAGTSLGLAVAKALAIEMGCPDWAATELAKRIGRGLRSAVGVHGFDRGGFILEAGKLPGESVAPLIGSFSFPPEWQMMLLQPVMEGGWHGSRELDAFDHAGVNPTDELARIVLTGVLPGLLTKDLAIFGESLHEYNSKAGEAFRSVQGDTYAHPAIAELIAALRAQGIRGVGQSSWGPLVFAVVEAGFQCTVLDALLANHLVTTGFAKGSTGYKSQVLTGD